MMNPYAKINQIIEKMKSSQSDLKDVTFSDGTIIQLTNAQIGEAIDSVVNSVEPNEVARMYLDKLENGITDNEGNCYIINAFNINQEWLWSDEA